MSKYLFVFLAAALASLVLTPLARSLALLIGAVDRRPRGVRSRPTARLGGLAIHLSIIVALLLAHLIGRYAEMSLLHDPAFFALGVGASMIMALGLLDDVRPVPPLVNLAVQILVASAMIPAGIEIQTILGVRLGFWAIPVTILWVVGITNAFNQIDSLDGLDGLATGVGLIVTTTLFSISLYANKVGEALVFAALGGSLLAFLRYNFHPAKIFLGNSGSLLLGFVVAVVAIQGSLKFSAAVAVLAPILAFDLPIMDNVLTALRRLLRTLHVVREDRARKGYEFLFVGRSAAFTADRRRVHQWLLDLGITHRKAVLLLYGICLLLCVGAFATVAEDNPNHALLLAAFVLSAAIGIRRLDYAEMHPLRRGALLPLFDLPIINRRIFHVFFDLCAIIAAYLAAHLIWYEESWQGSVREHFFHTLPILAITQIGSFVFMGVYERSFRHSGIADLLTMGRALALAVAAGWIVRLPITGLVNPHLDVTVLDGYLLASLVVGARLSLQILDHVFKGTHERSALRRVLIYGAGTAGVLALHEIRNNAALDMKAVGFIDDDPAKRKRILQDVRIFQVEDVEELVRSRMFDEVVVASWKIAEERLQKVVERCAVAGIPVRRFTVAWDDWRDASTERRANRRPRPEGRRDTGEPMHAPDRSRQSSDGVGGQGRSPEIALPSERPRLAEIRLSSPLEAEPRLTGAVSVLRKVSPEDAHAIARLHRSEIPRGFLSTLGEAFLSRLYGAIAEQEDSCVIVERDDRDEVIGFVTGTLSVGTCYTSVIRQHFFTLGPLVALRLLSFRRILHAVETFLQPVRTGETGAELLSIAVSPEYRGRGAGRRLVGALEEFFTNRDHADRYRVITDASDPRSNAFYSGLGFERRGESVHHGYRMAEYVKPIARGKTLAIEGGRPVRDRPLSPWPIFSAEAVQAAVSVLRSGQVNYWTGEVARRFEQGVAEVSGCKYGVAVANGTLALELALMALGIGPGDEVVVPSRTFIATSSSVVMRGATPIVADVDLDTQNITAAEIERVLTPRTKAVIVVHLCGWPCEMDAILELATRKNLAVIEDCAHAIGATYRGRPVGSLGDVAAFSFCNDKLITTGGEGGMVTTNRRDLWERAWSFKDHGKSYDAMFHRDWPPGFRTVHESFGTNWRMTEMQAAIGNAVLPKLPGWIERRRANAEKLSRRFERIPALRVAEPPEHVAHVYYKYVALVRSECLREGWDRDRIMLAIEAEGIPCRVAICSEIYLEKAFPEELRPPQRMPNARTIGETGLLFQVHPTLTREEIEDTCEAVEKVMSAASL